MRFLAEVGELTITPDTPARVVIDERTGTVVIGQNVQISTVAVTHGNISVRITERPFADQPNPFSQGETVILPDTEIEAEETGGQLAIIGGADLQTLVRGLNQIGLKPMGIIAILQAIKTAGALQADLVGAVDRLVPPCAGGGSPLRGRRLRPARRAPRQRPRPPRRRHRWRRPSPAPRWAWG